MRFTPFTEVEYVSSIRNKGCVNVLAFAEAFRLFSGCFPTGCGERVSSDGARTSSELPVFGVPSSPQLFHASPELIIKLNCQYSYSNCRWCLPSQSSKSFNLSLPPPLSHDPALVIGCVFLSTVGYVYFVVHLLCVLRPPFLVFGC